MASPDGQSRGLNNFVLRDPRIRRQIQRGLEVYRGGMRTRMVASGLAKRSLQSVDVDKLPEGEERECIQWVSRQHNETLR